MPVGSSQRHVDHDCHEVVRHLFPKLLTKLLRENKGSYAVLSRFKPLAAALTSKGCVFPKRGGLPSSGSGTTPSTAWKW